MNNSSVSKKALWTGWILTVLIAGSLIMSAVMKFAKPPPVIDGFKLLGWSENLAFALGILELACTVVFLLPPTAVLGAILLTGYLGGAIATHVRVGDPFISPLIMGVMLWAGIFLREPRLQALIPWRRKNIIGALAKDQTPIAQFEEQKA